MLCINVDEAAAFDMLAIAELKGSSQWDQLYYDIEKALGKELLNKVLDSKEYWALVSANTIVFDLLDHVEKYSATWVHDANQERYRAKKALQARFFDSALTEIKTHGT